MHADLVALLDEDDRAKRSVADAERAIEVRLATARANRDADRVLLERQRAAEIAKRIRAIEDERRRRAHENRTGRERLREARRAATDGALSAGVDVYLAIVGGTRPTGESS